MRPALRRDERQFRDLIENIPALAWSALADGSNVFVSRRWTGYTGLSAEDTAGWGWRAAVHPDDIDRYVEKWRASLASGEPFEDEARIRRAADGEYRWFLARAEPLRDERGSILAWYGMLTDIEDRKRAEQALRASEERFRMLASSEWFPRRTPDRCVGSPATDAGAVQEFIGTGMDVTAHELLTEELRRREAYLAEAQRLSHTGSFGWKPDTGEIIWSAETYRIFEYDRAVTPTIDLVAQRVHPEDRADFQSVIERASAGAPDLEHAYRLLLPDGRAKHVHALAHATQDASGNRELVGAVTDMTDHKRAEESLRASEAYLAEAQRLSQTGSWAWAPDQDIRYWSEECYRVLSFDPQDGLPRFEDFFRRIHPDDQPGFRELIQTAICEKAEWKADYRIVHPHGPVRDIHVLGHPVLSTSGHLVEFVGTVIDVTDRKRAEEELRRSQHYLAEAQKVSHTGSWAWSPVSNAILYWSEECYRILGYDPVQGLPSFESSLERIHPEDRPALAETIERAVREKAEFQIEYRLVLPDGMRRNVRILSHPVLDASGKLVEFIGTVMDVTEQKRAEEERKEHLWFLECMDRINRAMQRTNDVEGMMSGVLEETLAIFGSDRAWLVYPCDPDAATSRVVMEHTRPEYPGAFALGEEFPVDTQTAEILRRVLDGPGAVADLSILPEMRERFSIQSVIAIAVRPKGDRPYVFGLHQCSHARVWTAAERRLFEEIARRLEDALTSVLAHRNLLASQQELRTSEERFRTFVDHATDAFFLYDEEFIVRDVNRQACETLGYAREELIGMHPREFDADFTWERQERNALRLREHGSVTFSSRRRRKDGSVFPVEVRIQAFNRGGRLFYIALASDITERKHAEAERLKLEERLRQAEKMEAIGRFASGIAHDFNNVLGGIIAYGEMLFDEAPEDAPRKRYAQNVLTAATRGRDLVDQILAYTRSQRGMRRPTDVCRAVAETLELLRSSLPDSITLYATIPDQPLVVMGDATQLHQIVMNLCSNAIHAMSEGGSLRVTIAPQEVGADRALSHGRLRSGRYARASAEDSGSGMDEATLARIFEPFFTTKEVGRGTGLGLSLVYAIVTDFGGAIDVKSVPGEGSTFSIYLPMADVSTAVAATA